MLCVMVEIRWAIIETELTLFVVRYRVCVNSHFHSLSRKERLNGETTLKHTNWLLCTDIIIDSEDIKQELL